MALAEASICFPSWGKVVGSSRECPVSCLHDLICDAYLAPSISKPLFPLLQDLVHKVLGVDLTISVKLGSGLVHISDDRPSFSCTTELSW